MSSNYYFISLCLIGYAYDDDGEYPTKEFIKGRKQKDAFFGASNEPRYDRRTESVIFQNFLDMSLWNRISINITMSYYLVKLLTLYRKGIFFKIYHNPYFKYYSNTSIETFSPGYKLFILRGEIFWSWSSEIQIK